MADVVNGQKWAPGRGCVLVFDVLGSLLDEDTGLRGVVEANLDLPPERKQGFIARWSARFEELVQLIQTGREPYRNPEALYLQAVVETAGEQAVPLAQNAAVEMARFGRQLKPFADVPGALEELALQHPLVALTNAGSQQAFAMSNHAGLRWSLLVSGEVVQAYKPDPRMYQYVIRALDVDPQHCVFIAAHPWDLDAAAQHGFRSAYLDRAATGGQFEFTAPNLAELVPLLPSAL